MSIKALVPLRAGSKGIPKKNIKKIAGKPLCAWVLEAAAKSSLIDMTYVSTDSREIADIVENIGIGIKIIDRPEAYATDEASTEAVMLHFMQHINFDALVTIQATSPLLTSHDLDSAISLFKETNYSSMLSAVRCKRFFWADDATPINYKPSNRPRRQDFSGTLMENGAFYITTRDCLEDNQCRLGGQIGIYEMRDSMATELDEPEDWQRVEQLLLKHQSV